MTAGRACTSHPPEGEADPLQDAVWLYSYADLVTQLLLFIILTVTVVGLVELPPEAAEHPDEARLDAAARKLASYVESHALEQAVAIDRSADRLVVRLGSVLLFEPGQDTLTGAAHNVLTAFARVLGSLQSPLRVEGHTDNVPINTAAFASNWELSSARAIAVVRFLEDHGIASNRLAAAGYGEFHPILANDSPEHRATNRRVEILILGEPSHAPQP